MYRLTRLLRRRFRILFRKHQVEAELHEEMAAHLELEAADLRRQGWESDAARREASRRLGGVERTKEWVREERGGRVLDDLVADVRYAVRTMRRTPGFALVVVVILALGIGANTAIFSLLNTLLLQPLPYRDSDRVVFTLGWDWRDDTMRFNVGAADWIVWRDHTESFEDVAGYRFTPVNLTRVDQPARLRGYRVTPDMFRLLGVEAALGRTFVAADGDPGAEDVVVLSHALWRDRFGGEPDVVGRTLILNDTTFRVVGVMPSGFEFPQFNFTGDVWMPLAIDRGALETDRRASFSMVSVARLRPDVSVEQAQAELDAVYQRLEAEYPATNTGLGIRVVSMQGLLAEQLLSPVAVLMGTVGIVLLIACANVGCLLLARARVRVREVALRKALGAGRRRLVRQLLTESVVLALIGGGAGVLLSVWGLSVLRAALPDAVTDVVPALADVGIDVSVLIFTAALSLVATVFFGVAPALSLSALPTTAVLRGGAGDGGRAGQGLLSSLVMAEVALSAVLLVAAGLSTRSLINVLDVDPGFDATDMVVLNLTLPQTRFADPGRRSDTYEQIVEAVASLAAAEAAAVVNSLPLSTSNASSRVSVDGDPPAPGEAPRADYRIVSSAYFEAMRIPLRQGRSFDRADGASGAPVVVVNETFARRFLSDGPLGRRIRLGDPSTASSLEVVGVVGDVRHWSLTTAPNPEVYVPLRQNPPQSMTLAVRSPLTVSALAPTLQRAIREVDPDQPADDIAPMEELVARSVLGRRASGGLIAGFGGVALLLAIVGLYGVSTYTTKQRVPELAIRLALGARPGAVRRLVLRRGLLLAASGAALGLVAAAVGARVLQSLLYGLTWIDPVTFGAVGGVVVLAALVACHAPARWASRLDPMEALRRD